MSILYAFLMLMSLTVSRSIGSHPIIERRAGSRFGTNGRPSNGNNIGLPFSAGSGSGGSAGGAGMGAGPFSGAATNGGGSNGHGMGGSPFASGSGSGGGNSGSGGMGASPFASAMASGSENGGGSAGGSGGQSPFASALSSGSGMNPFTANMDGSSSSLMTSSGPGGLAGGDFTVNNSAVLMGHNFASELTGTGGGNDNGLSRFDTSAYQQMLSQMFNPGSTDNNLQTLGNPFDGSGYALPQGGTGSNNNEHYNTAAEASIGGYASTDMSGSGYGSYSGSASTQGSFQTANHKTFGGNTGTSNYNTGSGTGASALNSNGISSSSNTYSSSSSSNSNLDMANPFNVNNYDVDVSHNQLSSHSTNKGSNPFDTNKFNMGGSPFKMSNNKLGSGPAGNGMGQNPFDTSGYQSNGGTESLFATDTSEYSYRKDSGLDSYGNVDFAQLSGISGNRADLGISYNGASYSGHSYNTGSNQAYTDTSSYGSYSGTGTNSGISYSSQTTGTGANSGYSSGNRFETPFESDNYNDLLDNPFQAGSTITDGRQNYQQNPFPNSGANGQGSGFNGNVGSPIASGPGGDPFNQGGHSMSLGGQRTNNFRG